MEPASSDLLSKLRLERDWNMSTIFTDKGSTIIDNGCKL